MVNVEFEQLHVINLREHIEQQIRKAIFNGTIGAGERLVESTLADQLGVSRAPVREALSALEREGIVTNIPRRGYFVIEFTDKHIEEIYSLRLILEIGALKRAMARITPEQVQRLQQIVNNLGDAARRKEDYRTVAEIDLSFHELICLVADHSRLYSAWNSIRLQTWLLIGMTSRTHQDRPEQPKELHQDILDAILANDVQRAEANLTEHILDAQQRARKTLRAMPQATNDK